MVPFLKWVGGKRQLANEIKYLMPRQYNEYYEPFVGGGAIFLTIQNPNSHINDLNVDLITTYNVIKKNVYELMNKLDEMNELHNEEFYYKIREMDRVENYYELDEITRAARMIYLNKYCFNGMYRVNSKGYNNVPFNKKDFVSLYDKKNLLEISIFLSVNNIKITNNSYDYVLEVAQKGDFIYFDPPYDLLNASTFDSYSKDAFGRQGQINLANVFKELDKRGCLLMLSNHNTEFIKELYSEFNIYEQSVTRMINSNSDKRGAKKIEVIITNYKIENKERNMFEVFLGSMKKSIKSFEYYVSFDDINGKINNNIDGLNLLNSLIGNDNPSNELRRLIKEYGSKITDIIPMLVALRKFKIKSDNYEIIFDKEQKKEITVIFNDSKENVENIILFCEKTGLLEMFKNKNIKNVVDYMTGIEVGISTNARKNRTGSLMEKLVLDYVLDVKNIEFLGSEVTSKKLRELGFELGLEKANKRFDFAFIKDNKLFLMEVNYYSSSGSKLNETARSYITLNEQINKIDNIEFIWVTDGLGWNKAKNGLEEAYNSIKNLINIKDLENGKLQKIIEKK